jgi:hypothetical protein
MRTLTPALLGLFTLIATPLLAEEGSTYTDPTYGYAIDIPSGFEPTGEQTPNANGPMYAKGDFSLGLSGGTEEDGGYPDRISTDESYMLDHDWEEVSSDSGDDFTTYTVTSAGQVFTGYAIPVCDGSKYAAFQFEYPEGQKTEAETIVEGLKGSLHATDAAC